MTHSDQKRRQAGRDALAGLSLMVFLALSLGFGGIIAFRDLELDLPPWNRHHTGSISGIEAIWMFVISVVIAAFLIYLGVVVWLLFARLFFSKAEVSNVAAHGPHTRFDRWLVDAVFRK